MKLLERLREMAKKKPEDPCLGCEETGVPHGSDGGDYNPANETPAMREMRAENERRRIADARAIQLDADAWRRHGAL